MTKEIETMLKRIDSLEQEVALLKKQQATLLGQEEEPIVQKQSTTKTLEPAKEEIIIPVQGEEAVTSVKAEELVSEVQKVRQPEFDMEQVFSKWMPKVFMFILLLGILWGLKVAVDQGYITNVFRVIGGYIGAGLLYYFGMKFYYEQNKVFSYTLLGGFIAVGILTTFAAHHLYGYFSFTIAFLIGILFIALGLWLSKKTKSEILTVFSAIAGFLLPFLLEGESVTAQGFCLYLLILFMSLFYVALTDKHKYTFYITFIFFHFTMFFYLVLVSQFEDQETIVGTVFIQHFILLFIYIAKRISRHTFTEALIYTNFVFTLGWIKALEDTMETWAYGGLAIFYLGLTIYAFLYYKKLLSGVLSAISIFAVSAYILSFGYDDWKVTLMLLLLNGTIGIWVGLRCKTKRTVITGSILYLLTGSIVFFFLQFPTFVSLEHGIWLVFLYSVALIFYSIYEYTSSSVKKVDQYLIIGQVIVLNYVTRLTALALSETTYFAETTAHIYMLVFLIVFCGMYFFHKWQRGIYIVHASLIQFFILGLWVLFAKMYSYVDDNIIFNMSVEILYLVILTLLFTMIMRSRFYIHSEKITKALPLLATVLQSICFLFLNKWYLASTIFYALEREYVLLVHTFLLLAFAFISITIGRKFKWKSVKYFGALLVILCVIKLFLIDLVEISILVRAIMFIIVGVVGLLYSKTLFKEK